MEKKYFDTYFDQDYYSYTIKNDFIEITMLDFGATIYALKVNGTDVVLGFNHIKDYVASKSYMNCVIGRVSNRIKDGKFTIGDKAVQVSLNEGKNSLHGGIDGFNTKKFDVTGTDNSLIFHYLSPENESGYPGALDFTLNVSLDNNNVHFLMTGKSNEDGYFAPTMHTYFNLNGEKTGHAEKNHLIIYSDTYSEIGADMIPTGRILDVTNTPFDFRMQKEIGKDIVSNFELKALNGYDHNFILNKDLACTLLGPDTYIQMDISTNLPCMQLYTANNSMNNLEGKSHPYDIREGIALEPQFAPNAMNDKNAKSPLINKNETKNYFIRYTFYN